MNSNEQHGYQMLQNKRIHYDVLPCLRLAMAVLLSVWSSTRSRIFIFIILGELMFSYEMMYYSVQPIQSLEERNSS